MLHVQGQDLLLELRDARLQHDATHFDSELEMPLFRTLYEHASEVLKAELHALGWDR